MPRYKYESAQDWLQTKVNALAAAEDVNGLASIVVSVVTMLDGDQIQEVFEREMSDDGYFDDQDAPSDDEEE